MKGDKNFLWVEVTYALGKNLSTMFLNTGTRSSISRLEIPFDQDQFDALPLLLRCAFSGHSQLVSAILENKGNNNHLKKAGARFRGRHDYFTDKEGDGIIQVPVSKIEGERLQSQIVNNSQAIGLTHAELDLRKLDKEKIADETKHIL